MKTHITLTTSAVLALAFLQGCSDDSSRGAYYSSSRGDYYTGEPAPPIPTSSKWTSRTEPPRTPKKDAGTGGQAQGSDGGFNPNLRASSQRIDGYPAEVNGVRYPGYVTADMEAAYADCMYAADSVSMQVFPGTNDYWTLAEDAWEFSSPPQYPKNSETKYACFYGYLVVQANFL